MTTLRQTGLDIRVDETSSMLYFGPDVTHTGYGIRNVQDTSALLRDATAANPQERCYDFYRGIARFKDLEKFAPEDFRYDITAIMPGTVGGECRKTSGHYHGPVPGRDTTFPEVYEVLRGTAMYVLQKPVKPVHSETQVAEAAEFWFVEVREGESIVIPDGYGHCSINIGDGPLFFSNVAVVSCPLYYAPVKNMRGMGYYLMRGEDGALEARPNPRYQNLPPPRYARVKEAPELGIRFGQPVYLEFAKSPQTFHYLRDPAGRQAAFMEMLAPQAGGIPVREE